MIGDFGLRYASHVGVAGSRFRSQCLHVPGQDVSGPRNGGIYVRYSYGAFRQRKFECDCCEMLFFGICGERQNLYVYSLYSNPYLGNRIYDCLLESMATVKAEDIVPLFYLWVI